MNSNTAETKLVNPTAQDKFQAWAFLELMGHRKLAGFVQETEIASAKFLRIDVPTPDGKTITQLYAPASVYCITPTTEEMVRAWHQNNHVAPVSRYELDFKNPEPRDSDQLDRLNEELANENED